ncbi:MAG: PEGA domain-containing protein [Myxococcota bacterium]
MKRGLVLFLIAVILGAAVDADAARRKKRRGKRRARKGRIEVVTPVKGASVFLDGKLWGKTPLKSLRLVEKRYRVRVEKPGYLEFEQRVLVKAGQRVKVTPQLLPIAGVLRVSSTKSPATVFVDGDERGEAPLELELPVGSHEVRIVFGEEVFTEKVVAEAGEVYELEGFAAPSEDEDGGLALAPIDDDGDLALVAPESEDGLALVAPDDKLEAPVLVPPGEPGSPPDTIPGLSSAELARSDPLSPDRLTSRYEPKKAWYEEWWVWTAGGAVVVAAVTTAILLSGDDDDAVEFLPDQTVNTDGDDEGPMPVLP